MRSHGGTQTPCNVCSGEDRVRKQETRDNRKDQSESKTSFTNSFNERI